ncbi:hypothetical protein DFJ77DRAFT_478754 [Powellomyces hirtus]|nr:hypothetical protein DFJ77DRAFT_478754 [Powellomyces hirtus]
MGYIHPLTQKWTDIGRPPLIELLSRRKAKPTSIFCRLFVKDVNDVPSENTDDLIGNLAHDTVDALLNLVGLSTHYESAKQAYTVVQEQANKDASSHQTLERLGGVDALISYLARWGAQPREAARCVDILQMLESLDTSDLNGQHRDQLVDSFAKWLSVYKESELLAIVPYFKKRMNDDWFARLFLERHGFFPLLRLVDPTLAGKRSSDGLKRGLLEACQSCLHGDARRKLFATSNGIDVLVRLLEHRPSGAMLRVLLDLLSGFTLSEDYVDIFVERGGMQVLGKLLQTRKRFKDDVHIPLIKAVRRVATLSSIPLPANLRERLLDCLDELKLEAGTRTGDEEMFGKLMSAEVDRALNTLREKVDKTRSAGSDGKQAAGTAAVDFTTASNEELSAYDRPPPLIEFNVGSSVSEETISRLITLLHAREFHLRAEAVGIVRKITTWREFAPNPVQLLTRALITLMDDDDHIAVQAAGCLANLAAFPTHRPIMAGCRLLARLIAALSSYNVTLIEQVLQALKPFVSDDAYLAELSTTKSLRLLRVVVHAATSYGDCARFSYQRLLDIGDNNLKLDSQHLISQDPWEQVVTDWRSNDFVAHKEAPNVRTKPRRKKVKKVK